MKKRRRRVLLLGITTYRSSRMDLPRIMFELIDVPSISFIHWTFLVISEKKKKKIKEQERMCMLTCPSDLPLGRSIDINTWDSCFCLVPDVHRYYDLNVGPTFMLLFHLFLSTASPLGLPLWKSSAISLDIWCYRTTSQTLKICHWCILHHFYSSHSFIIYDYYINTGTHVSVITIMYQSFPKMFHTVEHISSVTITNTYIILIWGCFKKLCFNQFIGWISKLAFKGIEFFKTY